MTAIWLPIFCHNSSTIDLSVSGLDYPMELCDVRMYCFYNISAVGIYVDKVINKEFAMIHCNGSQFISTLSIEEVTKEVENQSRNTFLN